ncbi:AraC family transcriptional regulator [Acaryochloris marina]|uniref:AraC family transcriptional regulator n=1 Tax=Acaryochloris marina TaxID=155978 RepID=UPI0021C2C347|nr:AraC family transcriptional regulator [Acaryochloris marina]BDM83396.1 AraC family transcriptional regulator [Acaryochloris marina MBIC10699]
MNPTNHKFVLDSGWQVLLKDLGVSPQAILRQANLPLDLFCQPTPALTSTEYFRFWEGLETLLSKDPTFPLRIAQSITVESFSPPIFACICSENLNQGIQRLALYKRLIGPFRLDVTQTIHDTQIALGELPGHPPIPQSLIAMELALLVHLTRLATRAFIIPLKVQSTFTIPGSKEYEAFFGVPLDNGELDGVVFSAADAQKPFLTANAGMWSIFEPELHKRMQHLEVDAHFRDRVRACLMEILASGQCTMADVAKRLAVSTRTLQRRLQDENTSFKQELSSLRAELANHYLVNTPYSSAEISLLLGYSEPSSFFRAFHLWTGKTPDIVREMS